jgi:hypothetical protein
MLMALDPFTAGFDLIKTGLDKFFPDADTELKGKLAEAASQINNDYQLQLAQLDINKAEASSSSLFVSGWRPAIGWICGFSLCYAAILEPIARFTASVVFTYVGAFPIIDTEITLQILLALLGIAGMRSYEKHKGVAK